MLCTIVKVAIRIYCGNTKYFVNVSYLVLAYFTVTEVLEYNKKTLCTGKHCFQTNITYRQ